MTGLAFPSRSRHHPNVNLDPPRRHGVIITSITSITSPGHKQFYRLLHSVNQGYKISQFTINAKKKDLFTFKPLHHPSYNLIWIFRMKIRHLASGSKIISRSLNILKSLSILFYFQEQIGQYKTGANVMLLLLCHDKIKWPVFRVTTSPLHWC